MKALLATVVFSLNTVLLIAQEMHAEADSSNFKRFEAEVSWLTPIGVLKNYMNPTPLFGIWYRSQFSESSILNYGMQLSFPKDMPLNMPMLILIQLQNLWRAIWG